MSNTSSVTNQNISSCASTGNCVTMPNVSLRVKAITYQNDNLNLYYLYILIDFYACVIIYFLDCPVLVIPYDCTRHIIQYTYYILYSLKVTKYYDLLCTL